MIHKDNILNSPRSTKDNIAADIRRDLSKYHPREEFICSGQLYK